MLVRFLNLRRPSSEPLPLGAPLRMVCIGLIAVPLYCCSSSQPMESWTVNPGLACSSFTVGFALERDTLQPMIGPHFLPREFREDRTGELQLSVYRCPQSIVSGRPDANQGFALVSVPLAAGLNELFGDWEATVHYVPVASSYHPVEPRQAWLDTPDKASGVMIAALPVPLNVRDEDYAALVVAARIFGGGGMSNRLIDRLRHTEGWSYGAEGGISASNREGDDSGSVYLQAIAAPENLARVKAGALEELQRALDEGFTAEELQDAVDGAISGDLGSLSSDQALAGILRSGAQHGLDAQWYAAMHERYRALTLDEVNEAFRKYFGSDDYVIFIGGDLAKAEAAEAAAAKGS